MSALSDEARLIAAVLEIPAPDTASAGELLQWVEWWRPSYEAAQGCTDEHKAYLKRGGWWPPLVAAQIENFPPLIVLKTARPGLYRQR